MYRALVERRLASSVAGAILPTADPFLYTLSFTATAGTGLAALEQAALEVLDEVSRTGITAQELIKARNQLRARLVFDSDSVTHIAHQLGFFETIATLDLYPQIEEAISSTTADQVGEVAAKYLQRNTRTVGWFEPLLRRQHASGPVPASTLEAGSSDPVIRRGEIPIRTRLAGPSDAMRAP